MKQLKKRLQIIAVLMVVLSVVSLFAGCAGESTTTGGDTTGVPETTAPVNDETTAPSKETTPEPTEPSVDPTEPSVDPTEPSVDPTEPSVEPTDPSVDPTEPSVDPVTYKNANGMIVLTWNGTTADYSNEYTAMSIEGQAVTEEDGVYTVTIEGGRGDTVITVTINADGTVTLTDSEADDLFMASMEFTLRVDGEGFATVETNEEIITVEPDEGGMLTWTATMTGKIAVGGEFNMIMVYDEDAFWNFDDALAILEGTGAVEVTKGTKYVFSDPFYETESVTLYTIVGEEYDSGDEEPETELLPFTGTPVADTAYKFGMNQVTLGKTLYFNGTISGSHFLGTTENVDEAVAVYVEVVDGGYKMYFMDGETKTYFALETYKNAKGYDTVGMTFATDADKAAVFTWNTELNIFVSNYNNTDYYMGSYKEFATISVSKTTFINAENADVSQFRAVLYLEQVVDGGDDDNNGNEDDEPSIPTEEGKVTYYFTMGENGVEIPEWAAIYIIGGAWHPNWNADTAEKLTNLEGTNIWYLVTDKVVDGQNELKLILGLDADNKVTWENTWEYLHDGNYKFTYTEGQLIDLGEFVFSTAPSDPSKTTWSVVGNLFDTGWRVDFDLTATEEANIYEIELELTAGTEFKIRKNHKWSNGEFGNNGENVKVEADGVYTIRVNVETQEITLTAKEDNTDSAIKEILDQAFALEVGASMNGEYELTGVITEVHTVYGGSKYVMTIKVEGDGREVELFGVSGDYVRNLQVDDIITVSSNEFKNYNGTIELNKCTLVSYTLAEGHEPVVRVEHDALTENGNKLTIHVGGLGKREGWVNGMQYKTLTIREGLTVVINCTAVGDYNESSGKFYLSDDGNDTWRLYASENATFTLTSDKTIASIKVTYGVKQDETIERLTCNGETYESGAVITVNSNEVVLGATNIQEGSKLSAQVRIIEIEITYAEESNGDANETPAANYVKVTEDQEDWSGTYLFTVLNGENLVAFSGVDAKDNFVAVEDVDGTIAGTASLVTVTIEKCENGYFIKVGDKYIGGKENTNGISFEDEGVLNTITYQNGAVTIRSNGVILRLNTGSGGPRIRYFKDTADKTDETYPRLTLYKLAEV